MSRAVVFIGCLLGLASQAEARQTADQIARAIVIGQAYVSGNVYVAGFDEDEKRSWPRRITLVPLQETGPPLSADFFRTVTQDSEEQYYFPRRETVGDLSELDVFSTVDRAALEDRNLARYRMEQGVMSSVALFGWNTGLPLTDISYIDKGRPRPTTARERLAIDADKKSSPNKESDCTTVPQFLDAATVLLTAKLSNSNVTIRLSHYVTPGCAGHLSQIYVLDVLAPGQEPRRFEFRHYHGLI